MIRQSESSRHTALSWICQQQEWVGGCQKAASLAGVKEDQTEDIFQEALTAMTFNVMKGKFNGDSQLRTYLISISRNMSLKSLRNQKQHQSLENVYHLTHDPHQASEWDKEAQLKRLMKIAFAHLKEGCRKILALYGAGLPMDEIAQEMGYENKQSAKNKSKACRDKLKSVIESDPDLHSQLKVFV